jgi:hypothetical protein
MILAVLPFTSLEAGSQADWIAAIASIFAAIGLTITLLLQWKTSSDQSAILKFEKEKDRRILMPWFKVSEITEQEFDNYIGKGKYKIMQVTLQNANAFNLECKANGNPAIRYNPTWSNILEVGQNVEVVGTYKYDPLGGISITHSLGYLRYSDIEGRKYEQEIYFDEGFRGLPKLI